MFNRLSIALLFLIAASASANPAYPLKLKAGARYLVDQNNTPFFIQGDAPWELMQNLNGSDTQQYITNRANKGYNTILCEAIEHQFSTHPPTNAYNQPPFLTKVDATHWNFASTNELYWTNVDAVIRLAGVNGIQVMFFPAYLGFGGGNEGWYADMQANTLATLTNYGKFIANRYMNYTNLIYVMGGDYVAADMTIPDAVAYGILSIDSNHLMTAHSSRNISAVGGYNRPWLNFNSTYGGYFTYTNASNCYTNSSTPSFLIEEYYENESINNLPSTPTCTGQQLRNQEWWAVTSGNMGFIMGNNPLWFLNDGSVGWQTQMDSIGSRTSTNIYQMLRTRPWWNLVPDTNNTILTAGFGTRGDTNWVSCCRDTNSESVICYIPQGPVHTLTIDMTKLAHSQSKAWWYNPSNNVPTQIGIIDNLSTHNFVQPDANDWVLVVDSIFPGFTAPGDLSIIPTEAQIPWIVGDTVGIRGGIPVVITVFTNVYASNALALTSIAAACPSNQVVVLAETSASNPYVCSNGFTVNKNGVVIRGMGSNTTVVGHMSIGHSSSLVGTFGIASGSSKGSTEFVVSWHTNQFGESITTGDMLKVSAWFSDTNADFPVLSVAGYKNMISQPVIVTNVSGGGNTIDFYPPLVFDFTNTPQAFGLNESSISSLRPVTKIGLENFTLVSTNNGFDDNQVFEMNYSMVRDSWLTNVNILFPHNYCLNIEECDFIQVDGCAFRYSLGSGTSHSGLLLSMDSGVLIQNNIIADITQLGLMFNDGFSGNAIFGNFFTNNTVNGDVLMHNTHPVMNLWEQNIWPVKYVMDGYFGSASHQTIFRNYHPGSIAYKRNITYMNTVGNVIGAFTNSTIKFYLQTTNGFSSYPIFDVGFPNIGNNTFLDVSPPVFFNFPGTWMPNYDASPLTNGIFTFTNTVGPTNTIWITDGTGSLTNVPAPNSSNYPLKFQDANNTNLYWPQDGIPVLSVSAGTATNLVLNRTITFSNGWRLFIAGQIAYQHFETNEYQQEILHGNLVYTNTSTGTLAWDPLIANRTIPTSILYPSGPPGWWTTNRWPAVDISNVVSVAPIPAELRYANAPVSDPNITVQPQNSTVTAPATATFTVTATGTAPVTYQWSKNGTPIGGATLSTYTTPATSYPANNGDTYYVVVTSGVGSLQSSTATLTVNSDITINTQPQPQSVSVGATATFTVSATSASSLTLSYAWTFNGVSVGGNSSSYARSNCQLADSGLQAQVTITDSAGSIVSSAATLTVNGISPPVNLGVSLGSGTHRFGNGTQNIGTK